MKSFQQLREDTLGEDYSQSMPQMLVLRRKSIRIFPDGVKVAMYYSDKLKKYISVPFGPETLNPEDQK